MLNRQVAWVSDSADHGNDEEMVGRYGIGVSERHHAAILVDDICGFFLSDDPGEDVLGIVYGKMEHGYSPYDLVQVCRRIITQKMMEDSITTPPLSSLQRGTIYLALVYTRRSMHEVCSSIDSCVRKAQKSLKQNDIAR